MVSDYPFATLPSSDDSRDAAAFQQTCFSTSYSRLYIDLSQVEHFPPRGLLASGLDQDHTP
jgi:hypothetical protein